MPVGEFHNPTAPLTAIRSSSRNRKDWGSVAFPRAAQSCQDAALRAGYQTPPYQVLPLNYAFGFFFFFFFFFFQNKHAECSMLAALNIQIKYHCMLRCPGNKEK